MNTNLREKRYKEKLELIEERIVDIVSLIDNFSDKIIRLACYKAFQELSEATFDIIAMIVKDRGKIVEDDYNNLEKIERLGLIDSKDVKVLQEVNGLRNRIVHRYNKTDDEIAKESMGTLVPSLKNIISKLTQNEKDKQYHKSN